MKMGHVIKYYRVLYNLTQGEVAEISGINEKYLGRLERDESVPTIDKVEQLCKAFDIRMSDLLMVDPTKAITLNENQEIIKTQKERKAVYYCNCCGTTFFSDKKEVRCPQCNCLYDEENGYIEKSFTTEY